MTNKWNLIKICQVPVELLRDLSIVLWLKCFESLYLIGSAQ